MVIICEKGADYIIMTAALYRRLQAENYFADCLTFWCVAPGATGRLGRLPGGREGRRDPLSSDEEQQLRQSHGGRGERRLGHQPQGVAPEVCAARRPGEEHHPTQGPAGHPEVQHIQLVQIFFSYFLLCFIACPSVCSLYLLCRWHKVKVRHICVITSLSLRHLLMSFGHNPSSICAGISPLILSFLPQEHFFVCDQQG